MGGRRGAIDEPMPSTYSSPSWTSDFASWRSIVRGEFVDEREEFVEDAALVALDALEANDLAALSGCEVLAQPAVSWWS